MRILLVSNYRESTGGISGQVKLLYEHLKREGEEVKVFSMKGNPLMRLWLLLKLFVVASRYNVLHIHACSYWGFLPAVYGIMVGKLLQKRIVMTYHGGDGGGISRLIPKWYDSSLQEQRKTLYSQVIWQKFSNGTSCLM